MARWKPNATQRKAYAAKMREAEEKFGDKFIESNGPIREGCYVEYVDKASGRIIKGEVRSSSYGVKAGQHTFNIDGKLVKGRNLYGRLLVHIPGEQSRKVKLNAPAVRNVEGG